MPVSESTLPIIVSMTETCSLNQEETCQTELGPEIEQTNKQIPEKSGDNERKDLGKLSNHFSPSSLKTEKQH